MMEALQQLHRKQQRDLQSQITQKKKSASKKTRKGVNDECARLEEELKERQQQELAELDQDGDGLANVTPVDGTEPAANVPDNDNDLLAAIAGSSTPASTSTLSAQTSTLTLNDNEAETSSSNTTRKPNRQKARLARRAQEQETLAAHAASEAANLPDRKQQERTRMLEEFERRGLKEKEVAANGHCLYSAVADQMRQLGLGSRIQPDDAAADKVNGDVHNGKQQNGNGEGETSELRRDDYKSVRQAAAQYISTHEEDFAPFLEEPLDDYVHKIRDTGEWGGQLELMALARTYGIDINVLQGEGRVEKIEAGQEEGQKKVAWLAYYRHGFGLGEHYNSLRKS